MSKTTAAQPPELDQVTVTANAVLQVLQHLKDNGSLEQMFAENKMSKTTAGAPRAPTMEQSLSDSSSRQLNYTEKYLPDTPGEELAPDARAWKVYLDEQEEHDKDMVTGFRANIDTLIVLASLLCSIIISVATPAGQRLEPDHLAILSSMTFEALQYHRAQGNATLISAISPSKLDPESVTHTSTDVWGAWFFFTSLAVSLVTTLFAVLARQWLQEYYAFVPGNAKWRSLTRQFRSDGLWRWRFQHIVGSLPLLLHMALALCFAGLCTYVKDYHPLLVVTLGLISAVATIVYLIAGSLPAIYPDCPYRIPALLFLVSNGLSLLEATRCFFATPLWPPIKTRLPSQQCRFSSPSRDAGEEVAVDDTAQSPSPVSSGETLELNNPALDARSPGLQRSYIAVKESNEIQRNMTRLEILSLDWLYNHRAHESVQHVITPCLTQIILKYGKIALDRETVSKLPSSPSPSPSPPSSPSPSPLSSLDSFDLPLLQSSAHPTPSYNINALRSAEAMTPPESLPLETLHSWAVAVLNGLSGSKTIEGFPELLEFYVHSCPLLGYSSMFPESWWPSLINSPHLELLLSHGLLPLNIRFSISPGFLEPCEGSPLQIACYVGRWDIVRWLLHHRPAQLSLTEVDSHGWQPLGRAVASSKISTEDWEEIVAVMQRYKVDVMSNEVNSMKETALHLLCENGADLAKIIAVIPRNYEMEKERWNLKRLDGQTPLHRLCARRSEEHQRLAIANYLLSKGTDVGAVDDHERTPLHFASFHSLPKIVEVLLSTVEEPQDVISHCAAGGRTALHFACSGAHRTSETVKTLLSHGAGPNTVDEKGNLPLHFACAWRPGGLDLKADIIEILLKRTENINVRNVAGHTPLNKLQGRNSVSQEFQKACSLMVDHGAKSARELEELGLSSPAT